MFYSAFLLSVFFFGLKAENSENDYDLNITQTINKYGYPVETHEVTTEDGYILNIFRIPHGKEGSGVNEKTMLVMHGLFGQAENFIIAGIYNASLAYHLADNGYDVWLGNSRGNHHGKRHIKLSPNIKAFWNFSWHEIGINDIPAMIDYILEKKKIKQIYYTGHSQGATAFYVMATMKPEYQNKIKVASLLAPAAFMDHFKHKIIWPLLRNYRTVLIIADLFYEFIPESIPIFKFLFNMCKENMYENICLGIYNTLAGSESGDFRKEILPLVMKYAPSVSFKQIQHFVQAYKSAKFRQFDYGRRKNLEIYGSPEPPDYPLNTINVPVASYYSKSDKIVDYKDIEHTCDVLPNIVRKFSIPTEKFTHLDFVLHPDTKSLIQPVLQFLEKYDRKR
ncbi:hypothetical protein WA026_020043 [Henosepilachna vigintioctopunctata]|uniref:Lipase n=1 Tax=Henosepilachna vigintioctopunctata TaxID=420089 RepID=A0AAW1V5E1_9CUCU